MLALEFIDGHADVAVADVAAANTWLAGRRIRSALPPGSMEALADLRAAIESLLRAAAEGREPSIAALDLVNAASAGAPAADQLDWPAGARPRRWLATSAAPERHVHALLARSAMQPVEVPGDVVDDVVWNARDLGQHPVTARSDRVIHRVDRTRVAERLGELVELEQLCVGRGRQPPQNVLRAAGRLVHLVVAYQRQ